MKSKKTPNRKIPPLYARAMRIRAFETKLLSMFGQNKLRGTVHTCVGQEICAAALYEHLSEDRDAAFSNHRCHGHFLAYGGDAGQLFAELLGRKGAVCGGRGGSQHLHYKSFFSNGIQGGMAPVGVGFAFARKRRGEHGAITVVHLGDGTLGEGALYEALCFASLLNVPVLFVLENNGYAQSTDTSSTTPGGIIERALSFGIESHRTSDSYPEKLASHLGEVVSKVRRGKPFFQVIDTRRLMAHSKGDDSRPKEIVESLWRQDPLTAFIDADAKNAELFDGFRREMDDLVEEIEKRPPAAGGTDDSALFAVDLERSSSDFSVRAGVSDKGARVVDRLNRELDALMKESKDVVLIGEDLLDPYGGAFKVLSGLSTKYRDQVFSTPISEAAIVGISNGMALAGARPVAEMMFSDFATLAADQTINHMAKFHYMYGGKVKCPVTLRLPSGGGRGYGPTHSQSLECLFCGTPGLRVVSMSLRHDPGKLLAMAVRCDDPVIFVENKNLYGTEYISKPPLDMEFIPIISKRGDFPPLRFVNPDERPQVTLVACGGAALAAESAMLELVVKQEIVFDYFVLTQLWPVTAREIAESVLKTRRLVTVEETVAAFGIGASIVSAVAQDLSGAFACRTVGSVEVPIPAAKHLEDMVLPTASKVVKAVLKVMEG
jgi:2-oxoisovalerate dehydrogenase E1 component